MLIPSSQYCIQNLNWAFSFNSFSDILIILFWSTNEVLRNNVLHTA